MRPYPFSRLQIVLSLLVLLAGWKLSRAQQVCHLIPAQLSATADHNLQNGALTLDFAVDRLSSQDPLQIDSIVLCFYSPDYCVRGGEVKLDTVAADQQIKFLKIKSNNTCPGWYRMAYKVGPKSKLTHFRRLLLRGPELHATTIALARSDQAPRLLVYGSSKSSRQPFQWLSLYGDGSNSGRSSTFWDKQSPPVRPSQPYAKVIAQGIASNSANVLYHQDLLESMTYLGVNYELRRQSPSGGAPSTGPRINGKEGFVTLKTRAGWQYLKVENHIDYWAGNGWTQLHQITTGTTNTLQAGPDGRIYVSDANLTAYSAYPEHRKLWTRGFGADNNKGCTLAATNAAGDLVYVVAHGLDSLYALDAATGARRGACKVEAPSANPVVVVGLRGTVACYTGRQLYFLSRDLRSVVKRVDATPELLLSQPVWGSAEASIGTDEFIYLQGQELILAKITLAGNGYASTVVRRFTNLPQFPITAMVADKSEHVYLIDRANVFFSSFEAEGWPTGLQVAQLIPAPDGSVYALDRTDAALQNGKLYALRYRDMGRNLDYQAGVADGDITVANQITIPATRNQPIDGQHMLVATDAVKVADNVTLSKTAHVSLVSGSSISFGKGFQVQQGATLKCTTGYK